MKNILYKFIFTSILLLLGVAMLKAQINESVLKNMVQSKKFIFQADMAIPQEGQQVRLTPQYTFTVSNDTISAALPYFGKAFKAPANPANVSIDFITTNFTYSSEVKSSGWEISIKPDRLPDVRDIFLDIYTNGKATLRIMSVNRQNISYNGYIVYE